MSSWLVGAPVVLCAVLASGALLPRVSWSLSAELRVVEARVAMLFGLSLV